MRWRITSARPGFWDTACCSAAAAWAGGGGFWPATSVGRTKSTEHRPASANTRRSTTPRGELLRALCCVIMALFPPKGSGTERGPNLGPNSRAVKRLKREQGAVSGEREEPKGIKAEHTMALCVADPRQSAPPRANGI